VHAPSQPLLHLREQGRRPSVERHALDGPVEPWPDALDALTGAKQMDATAILDYFAPLSKWLDEQLAGKQVGW
jgi:hypothetical protein